MILEVFKIKFKNTPILGTYKPKTCATDSLVKSINYILFRAVSTLWVEHKPMFLLYVEIA